jgi:hypothetical protein
MSLPQSARSRSTPRRLKMESLESRLALSATSALATALDTLAEAMPTSAASHAVMEVAARVDTVLTQHQDVFNKEPLASRIEQAADAIVRGATWIEEHTQSVANHLVGLPAAFRATANSPVTATVARVLIPGQQTDPEDLHATIDWGDGTEPSAGTVTQQEGRLFVVSGTHTYATAGNFTPTISITDAAEQSITVRSHALVAAATV